MSASIEAEEDVPGSGHDGVAPGHVAEIRGRVQVGVPRLTAH
eukprot:CAMPEP_0206040906 /NCGR_PEP_ID=MMETSP1466-20131121/5652_1 /ASSEMBLY_ACC=CAM_ASM_001126 /TAXON_ID=44452 /ORGANISM="Pavlova gyrans, Strain CCMP608" /LENGTH=41 /DNA_ID= /DNA_START= /DNA_END= /DNA_ORIENTATION=